ncbi:hypothetical protein STIAU_0706 [Stigmatella aurantiaca DW4/3-1]|uniref:Uncharacterized protein n=1 Tax=Stigmatella aurantiaca (strain DW4/3-1) TaxID=378806 RepID=Q08UZ2_STIAD|nr:hypothetical protein STIAU_0706 [Stigmatella aurantiaca DW4/3-1]
MPIWTVARKRSGSSRSASTAGAELLPASTNSRSRVFRREMMAISAPAKIPLASTSSKMMANSVRIRGLLSARGEKTKSGWCGVAGP